MLELHYWPTPNGRKVTILLEELGVAHKIVPMNIGRGDQFNPDILKFSPNNRMPALVDTAPRGGGEPVRIFESAAIMMYIAEKEGRFFPQETHKKYDVVQWLMWQMSNQGPKMGEQGHFFRASQNAANGDLAYANTRFADEVHRIYGVMNLGLHKKEWLAAGEYTIADMICYPWAATWKLRKIDLEEFPNVKAWMDRLEARPALKKAMEAALPPEAIEDPASLSDEEKARRAKLLTNQRATKIPRELGLTFSFPVHGEGGSRRVSGARRKEEVPRDYGGLWGLWGQELLSPHLSWLDDMPVALVDRSGGSPVLYYIHADHLNRPQKITNGSAAIVWDGVFDPFGNAASVTGTVTNPLRFPGQYQDSETNLAQNWFRDYDSSIGRYAESDPIGIDGGLNLYDYASGGPINRWGPTGLM